MVAVRAGLLASRVRTCNDGDPHP